MSRGMLTDGTPALLVQILPAARTARLGCNDSDGAPLTRQLRAGATLSDALAHQGDLASRPPCWTLCPL